MVAGRRRCSTSIFAFLPRLKFFFCHLFKTSHFQGIWKRNRASELLLKSMIPNAHALAIQDCLPPEIENFLLPLLKLVIFKAYEGEPALVNLYTINASRQKTAIQDCLPPEIENFLLPFVKTSHFQGIWRRTRASKLIYNKRFPPKDLEKFYSRVWYQMRMLSLYKTDFLEVDHFYGIWKRRERVL